MRRTLPSKAEDRFLYEIRPITPANLHVLEPAYQAFQAVAQSDYGWPTNAIALDNLGPVFASGLMQGYMLCDAVKDRVVGFMFYQIEAYRALEIKMLYMDADAPVKPLLDVLMPRFIEDIKLQDGWDVVSYPVLGPAQARYVQQITWYGFKPVGQAVVKFHLLDGISVEIMSKQTYAEAPEGYRFATWDPRYEDGVVDVIQDAFSQSVDALWDPRFRSREGVAEAIAFLQSGHYGLFWPSCTTLLMNPEDKPVGVCFLNMVSQDEANIPLIGLMKSERRHKLGRTLLSQTVSLCVQEVLNGKSQVKTISATVATENIPAIRMYRHTAFQEDHWYPHVYQERSSVLIRKPGQWC